MNWLRAIAVGGTLLLLAATGCNEQSPRSSSAPQTGSPPATPRAPRVIRDFDLKITKGVGAHDLTFIYRGNYELEQVKLFVKSMNENASTTSVGRFWNSWKPGEEKTVEFQTDTKIEQISLEGTAFLVTKKPAATSGNGPAERVDQSQLESVQIDVRWKFE